MAYNKIITSEGNVQFQTADGNIINVHPFHIYTTFNEDTVSFILIAMPKYSGLAIFTSKASDLEVDGTVYTIEQLPNALSEAFAKAGAVARYEIVDELPTSGQSNTIYLVPKEEGVGYDEYIYVNGEWELIGDTDIEFDKYLTKEAFSAYSAATELKIDGKVVELTQAEYDSLVSGGTIDPLVLYVITDAVEVNMNDYYKKTETSGATEISTALASKADTATTYTKTEVDTALTSKQTTLTAGTGISIVDNVISATGGGSITVDNALDDSSENPVQNKVLYDELRLNVTGQTETLLQWEQYDGGESTNYPSGCTKITIEVDENEMTYGSYTLNNNNYDCFGAFAIESNSGVITVSTHNCEGEPITSITYSISDNVVTIEYPTITDVTIIGTSYDNYWTIKAISGTSTVTPLIDQVSANTTALSAVDSRLAEDEEVTAAALNNINDRLSEDEEVTAAGLNALNGALGGLKLVKLTQTQYDNLQVKDQNILYIIVN